MKARYLFRTYKARYRDQRGEFQAILPALRRGDVAVDVGTNKGAYLYWLRRAVGAEGRVVAFEPQAALAEYLRGVVGAFHWQNVKVEECALAEAPGQGTLYVPGDGVSPGATLSAGVLEHQAGQSLTCQIDTLDRRLANAGRVAVLKVDAEGFELPVFRGGAAILQRDRPLILVECEARHLRTHRMEDVFAFLAGLGYAGEFFSPQGLRPLAQFDARIHQKQAGERFWDAPDYCNNFLFRARS
jgi:FkbM family methyltransferase